MDSKLSQFNPIVIFLYFVVTVAFSMFVMHPVFLIISVASSVVYSIMIGGIKALKFNVYFILPMAVVSTLINIVFNHNGQTVVGYLPGNIPVSYESIIAGLATSAMIASVICWFSCYNQVMTNDKFIYLFGRIMPSVSLTLSMVFRFVPRFKSQFKKTVSAQRCIGFDISKGKFPHRIKNLAKVISVMTTWALENSIETADSMRGRGYGLKGKTNFNIYKFQKRDLLALIYILSAFSYIFLNILQGNVSYEYYPTINIKTVSADIYILFLTLCAMPIITEAWETLKWKYYQSKI